MGSTFYQKPTTLRGCMLDKILAAFHQHGLQALPYPATQETACRLQILIGEMTSPEWSCLITIVHLSGAPAGIPQQEEDGIFCNIIEGPNKGKIFSLKKLLEEGSFATWQFLGGRDLPNANRIKTARIRRVIGGN